MREINIVENGIFIQWLIDGESCLKLLHFFPMSTASAALRWITILNQASGRNEWPTAAKTDA